MNYHGADLVYVIDGMNGVEAAYCYAGMVGMLPDGITLRRLWKLAAGKIRHRRSEMFELAQLVWGFGDIDVQKYLCYGIWEPTGAGGPPQIPPELQAGIDAEIAKTYEQNPELRKLNGMK